MKLKALVANSETNANSSFWQLLWRYGFLVICLGLLVNWLLWLFTLPPDYPYDRYGNGVLAGMLLINHVAFAFKWKPSIGSIWCLIAYVCLLFGMFYIFYWSNVLFPK
jgi:hypothetical protein